LGKKKPSVIEAEFWDYLRFDRDKIIKKYSKSF